MSAGSANPALLDHHFDPLPARVLGVLRSPRATLTAVAGAPRWAGVLVLTFLISTISTAALLQTEVGRVALVDQWERTASAFGQNVDDRQYAALEDASSHGTAYAAISSFASGPLLAFGLAALLLVVFNGALGGAATYPQLLAITAHASVILALRQLIAAPVNYTRETLASPMTMTIFFSMLDEASPIARLFGVIDLFVVWWLAVLAIGLSVLYRRPTRRVLMGLVGAYVVLALLLVIAMAVTGGTV
ncbi:MAG: YIP1 family protein [Vicinamibacterales bacterium]|nr:YIP1 family protein [Vicinamibacterales bacterium]